MKEEYKVLVRIALYVIAGMTVRGGWMPQHIAEMFAGDPYMVELATGLIMGAITLGVYWYSNARKALKSWVS